MKAIAHINSAEDIESHFPVFSRQHAETIWDILCDTLEYDSCSNNSDDEEDELRELNTNFIFPPDSDSDF